MIIIYLVIFMKLRLFIAINLPENIKDEIAKKVDALKSGFSFPIRFLNRENWHLTLVFLGYQDVQDIEAIMNAIQATAQRSTAEPLVELTTISYGPIDERRKTAPRMIWLNGSVRTSEKLSAIKKSLEANLRANGVNFQNDYPNFHAHLTLARFLSQPRANLPPIEKPINLKFTARSLDIMQSHLKRSGAQYEVLQSFAFKI